MSTPWRQLEGHERVRELTSGWSTVIPSLTVIAVLLAWAVVPLVTALPVLPDAALALLIAWNLYRPDLLAPWAALPLGLAADIFTGQPAGVSATVWPATLLALTLIEPRFPMRDTRMDWLLAAAAIMVAKLVAWRLLAAAHLPLPFMPVALGIASTILFFPLVARLAAWVEQKWLVAR